MSAAMDAAADGVYQARVALAALKHELNELRDVGLTEAEMVALFEVYNEAGR